MQEIERLKALIGIDFDIDLPIEKPNALEAPALDRTTNIEDRIRLRDLQKRKTSVLLDITPLDAKGTQQ